MDIVGEEQGRLERLAVWLEATRAELVGLSVLLTGAAVATGALWWSATADPADVPSEVTGIREVVDSTDHHDHHSGAEKGAGGTTEADPDDEPAELTIHVTGAVADPGLVTVPPGARVADALARAGDPTAEAELHLLNLARPLDDGEQIHVPREGEELPAEASRPGNAGDHGGPVDLNRADAAVLETLPGIGPARAAAIIEHRDAHGPFAEPGDLRDVPGIGEATFQRLAEEVTTS